MARYDAVVIELVLQRADARPGDDAQYQRVGVNLAVQVSADLGQRLRLDTQHDDLCLARRRGRCQPLTSTL
jgi:hypothetical protein